MKKKLAALGLAALMCFSMTGCLRAEESDSSRTVVVQPDSKPSGKYKIGEDTSIESDFEILGLELKAGPSELALTDIKCAFPDENLTYFYFNMPCDTEQAAYRVDSIVIDGYSYAAKELVVRDYYQKYAIENLRESTEGVYEISKVKFSNLKNPDDTQTMNLARNITMGIGDSGFVFTQEYLYSILLQGQCFESVYQFNKENNVLVDLWAHVIGDLDLLDGDKRSFFYFAFNCYDTERGVHFTPQDILQLDVEFTRMSYQYEGKDAEQAKNIQPVSDVVQDTISPDVVKKVTAADEKRSNERLYVYHRINRLSEADLTKNVSDSNALVLAEAARQYDWAVQFGDQQGYPYKITDVKSLTGHKYDISYTRVKDFKTIHIVYRQNGRTISTKTESLVKDTTEQTVELVRKPTPSEKLEYEKEKIRQDKSNNVFGKAISYLSLYAQTYAWQIVFGVLAIVLILLGWLGFRNRKTIGQILHKLLRNFSNDLDDE